LVNCVLVPPKSTICMVLTRSIGRSDAAHSSNQEEDLHCLIMADTEDKVNKAKKLVHNIIETVRIPSLLLQGSILFPRVNPKCRLLLFPKARTS
jgi:hypothetical protein